MEEPNTCPKSGCGKPETATRRKAGRLLSICGNAHSWDKELVAEQRAKAKAAQRDELKLNINFPSSEQILEQVKQSRERMLDRLRNGPIIPY